MCGVVCWSLCVGVCVLECVLDCWSGWCVVDACVTSGAGVWRSVFVWRAVCVLDVCWSMYVKWSVCWSGWSAHYTIPPLDHNIKITPKLPNFQHGRCTKQDKCKSELAVPGALRNLKDLN